MRCLKLVTLISVCFLGLPGWAQQASCPDNGGGLCYQIINRTDCVTDFNTDNLTGKTREPVTLQVGDVSIAPNKSAVVAGRHENFKQMDTEISLGVKEGDKTHFYSNFFLAKNAKTSTPFYVTAFPVDNGVLYGLSWKEPTASCLAYTSGAGKRVYKSASGDVIRRRGLVD